MAARDTSLRFDIIGRDLASDAFLRAGRSVSDMGNKMDAAATKAAFLDDALKRQRETARRTSDAALSLARSDDILTEVEHRLRDGALEAEYALKREAEAKKKSGDAARKAAEDNGRFAASLQKIASWKDKGGPWWLGPALGLAPAATSLLGVGAGAAIGLGGAAVAGGGALAAFGAIARPVLADAMKAQQAVNTIQNNLAATLQTGPNVAGARAAQQAANTKALLSYNAALAGGANPAKALAAYQLTLAKNQATYNAAVNQGTFAAKAQYAATLATNKAYADLSPQQIALSKQLGAMAQGWQNLKAAETPVVAGALQPWLRDVTDLTGKLAPIIAKISPVIRDLGTQFGILVNSSVFNTFRDFIANTGSKVVGAAGNALIDLLDGIIVLLPKFAPLMTGAANAVSGWGDSFARWANSQKAADAITRFMAWFHQNGPAVGGLLKNIGLALKALAPGLAPAATTEINVISGFFALIAKLPPSIAKPLVEIAGVMLTLNKLGVVGIGVKLLGLGGAGAAGEAAAGGAAAGMWSKLLPGVRLAGGALAATLIISTVLKGTSSGAPGKNWWDNPFGQGTYKDPKSGQTKGTPTALTSWITFGHDIEHYWDMTWRNTITRTAAGFHDVAGWFNKGRHETANIFDGLRHDVAHIWDMTWNNTVGRLNNGMNDTDRLLGGWEHNAAHWFDTGRHDIAAIWDLTWRNTVDRVSRGTGDIMRWVGTLPGRIGGVFANAGTWLYNAGKNVIQGLWNGLTFIWDKVTGWISGLAGWIKAHKGPVSLDQQLLYPAGRALMSGLKVGLEHGFVDIKNIVTGAASDIGKWVLGGGNKILGLGLSALHGLTGAAKSIWDSLFGGGGGGGNAGGWIAQALKITGAPASWAGPLGILVGKESGGNPRAVNPLTAGASGEHAEGLFQTIPSTFAQFALPGHGNIWNPVDDAIAGIRYIMSAWGSPSNIPGLLGGGTYMGYASGTMSAAPGWAWVGERGRELMHFRGGEQVFPEQVVAAAGGGTQTIIIQVDPAVAAVTPDRTLGRHIAANLTQFIKGGGRIYPAGVAPR